jgi:TolA-binding protein
MRFKLFYGFWLILLVPTILLLTTCAHFKPHRSQKSAPSQNLSSKTTVSPALPESVSDKSVLLQPVPDNSALPLYSIAKEHLDSLQYDKALAEFNSFKQQYPNHPLIPYCNFHIAECSMQLGNIEQARTALCAVQIRDKQTMEYFKQNNLPEKALIYLDRFLTLKLSKPQLAEVELQKGIYQQMLNDGLGARESFAKAVQLAPKSDTGIKALYYQGLSFLNEQTFSGLDAAKERFTLIMKNYPSNPIAVNSQFYLTVIQYRLRTQDNRITPYEEFIKKYPNSAFTPRAYYLAGITAFEVRRDYKTGFAYFNKTIDLLTTLNRNGDDPPVTYWQEAMLVPGDMLYKNWDFIVSIYLNHYGMESTRELANELQISYPVEHGVHQLGKLVPLIILQWQNNCKELVPQVDEYLAQYPEPAKKWLENRGTALYLKAFALDKLGRDFDAITTFDQLARECPETDCADYGLFLMGKCYEDLNDTHNAIIAYDRCISLFPSRHQVVYMAYLGKAKALAKLDRYQEAVATLDTFLLRWGNRYDCPKDAIYTAKQLKREYQVTLGTFKILEEE